MTARDVYIGGTNCVTPLGFDVQSNWKSLLEGRSGIKKSRHYHQPAFISAIDEDVLNKKFSEISSDSSYSKLEKILILALYPLVAKHKIKNKTAFFLSTTKGNIEYLEQETNNSGVLLSVLADTVAAFFGFTEEPVVVSNACVSGIMAVSVAKRMIQAGVYDHAFIVAGDCISEFVLSGFHSFQAISDLPCRPYDRERNGISLGEAGAAVYLTAVSSKISGTYIKITGEASINDANHISGPSRTGEGLYKSIASAMNEANIEASSVDFISTHGTATLYNDEMEAIALNRLHLQEAPLHSLKGYYGHTLGASGLLETVIAVESVMQNKLIPSKGYENSGVSQPLNIIQSVLDKEVRCFLKTASGFGGCNTAVLFEKTA